MTATDAGRCVPRHVAVLYHPRVDAARALAADLADVLQARGACVTAHDAWEWAPDEAAARRLDWVVSLGGDGTMLRTVRLAACWGVPIVGVNFGRLAFLAELEPADAIVQLPRLLDGEGRIEERMMLRCTARTAVGDIAPIDALNDVFVGRGRVAHAVRLEVAVNDTAVVRFVADGLVVASPTGSTAYSLSAGGPIVAPDLDAFVVTPVVPHPSSIRPLVLPPSVRLDIRVLCQEEAVLTLDGQVHRTLGDGDLIHVARSPHRARMLRLQSPDDFYASLTRRLRR